MKSLTQERGNPTGALVGLLTDTMSRPTYHKRDHANEMCGRPLSIASRAPRFASVTPNVKPGPRPGNM